MFFMRVLCSVILAIGYTTAAGGDVDAPLDLKNSDPQSVISARVSSLIDFVDENSSEGLPLCRRLDRKTTIKYYGKSEYRAVAVLLNGCEILNTVNPLISVNTFNRRRRMLRQSFKALLESKVVGNKYQELAKEIIGRVAKNYDESINLPDYSAVYKWVDEHFILAIRPTSPELLLKTLVPTPVSTPVSTPTDEPVTDVIIDRDALLGKSEDEYLSALKEKLQDSSNGLPFCDKGIYAFSRENFNRFIRPVAIVLFLCEPTPINLSKLLETQSALDARRKRLRKDFNNLLKANDLDHFEQKAKNVVKRLSEIIHLDLAEPEAYICKLVHMIRPPMNKRQSSSLPYAGTASLIDETVAVIKDRGTNKRKDSPVTFLKRKRKQTRTNIEINAETLPVREDLVGKQTVPESVPVQNKEKGLCNINLDSENNTPINSLDVESDEDWEFWMDPNYDSSTDISDDESDTNTGNGQKL